MNEEKMEKTVLQTLEKLEKLGLDETLPAELSWCWNSFVADKNPVGLIEKSQKAHALLSEKKAVQPRAVSQKLLDDLEKVTRAF
ncbi:hypothetical protein [Nitritalea halalkaliphila]|nr:hypothetical protein [Nitritalea halalkaliphila]